MAPKRRSPPLSSEKSTKRRAQEEPLEKAEPPIQTRKNPPRPRLQGLALPPPVAAPSRKPFSKYVPPPPSRKKQQQREQAPPSPTSSSSLSIPSDGSDEDEEDVTNQQQDQQQIQVQEPQQQQYARVKAIRKGNQPRYRPLIPTTLDPFSLNPNTSQKKSQVAPFGATFSNAEDAASAADRALIAMWGYAAAAPFLIFPQPEYYKLEDRQQRFGPELPALLNKIVEEGAIQMRDIKIEGQRARDRASRTVVQQRTQKITRIRNSKLIDESKECGLCSACRQPWLGLVCERKQTARRIGYNSMKIAEKMLENGVEIEEEEEETDVGQGSRLGPFSSSAGGMAETGGAQVSEILLNSKRRFQKTNKSINKKDLIWIQEPPKGKPVVAAKDQHNLHIESFHRHSSAKITGEAAAEAAAVATAIETSRLPGLATTAFLTKDVMMEPPQRALLRHAENCAAAGADVALYEEDDPRFLRPINPDRGAGALQCNICYGWHGMGYPKECPVLQAAYAVEPPQKQRCSGCGCLKGCKDCGRGDLPAAVWVPSTVPCSWVDDVNPATLDVMHAVQSMASAAAVDFDRPDVAGKLGPEALLALGLLAEEVAAAQVTANTSSRL